MYVFDGWMDVYKISVVQQVNISYRNPIPFGHKRSFFGDGWGGQVTDDFKICAS